MKNKAALGLLSSRRSRLEYSPVGTIELIEKADRIAQGVPEALSWTDGRDVGRLSRGGISRSFQRHDQLGLKRPPMLERTERLEELKERFPVANYFIFDTEHARFIVPFERPCSESTSAESAQALDFPRLKSCVIRIAKTDCLSDASCNDHTAQKLGSQFPLERSYNGNDEAA